MAKAKKLKIIPLGGLNEIGKNLTVFEYGKDIIVLDCGIAFPDEEMLGVDLVIPDFNYLIKNANNPVRELVCSYIDQNGYNVKQPIAPVYVLSPEHLKELTDIYGLSFEIINSL